jgi:uncharacterized protein DUF2325
VRDGKFVGLDLNLDNQSGKTERSYRTAEPIALSSPLSAAGVVWRTGIEETRHSASAHVAPIACWILVQRKIERDRGCQHSVDGGDWKGVNDAYYLTITVNKCSMARQKVRAGNPRAADVSMQGKFPPGGMPRTPGAADPVAPSQPVSRRLGLWEIAGGMHCSIIGTCLSDAELVASLRKHRLMINAGAESHDIHSHGVRTAAKSTPFARTLTKLLDRKFAGAIRLITRAEGEPEIRAVWTRLRDSGQIAAGYWGVMSLGDVPEAVRVQVFGEVHMLSHLNGSGALQLTLKLAEAERRNGDLETRLRRCEQAKRHALAERDAALAASAREAVPIEAARPAGDPGGRRSAQRLVRKLAKCTRALISARARARHAEEALARHPARVVPAAQSPIVREPPSAADVRCAASGNQQRILYLGGRPAMVPHLREIAEAHAAAFLHHDGGIEDSLHRIEEMIEHCDAVVCPIDCISHGACRMAKTACQRFNKRFMPIPTASRAGFERALERLTRLVMPRMA